MKQMMRHMIRPEAWIIYYFAFLALAVSTMQRMGMNIADGGDTITWTVVISAIVVFLIYKLVQTITRRSAQTGGFKEMMAGAFGMDHAYNRYLAGEEEPVISLPQYAQSSIRQSEEEGVYYEEEKDDDDYEQIFQRTTPQVRQVQQQQKYAQVPQFTLDLSSTFTPFLGELLNQNILFVGDRRSGKSNGMGRLAEQEAATLLPMVVFDTQGDFTSLAHPQFFPRGVLVGSERMAQEYRRLRVHPIETAQDAYRFGRTIIAEGLQVVVDLRYYDMPGPFPHSLSAQIMTGIVNGIDSWEREQESQDRVSCSIYLDEAHLWVPQQAGDTTMKMSPVDYNALQAALFSTIVRMGGKMGFGLRLASQRLAEIDNRALQSMWTFLYRQSIKADLDRVRSQYGLNSNEVSELPAGECFVIGPGVRTRVQMKERTSPHGGESPTIEHLLRHQRTHQTRSVESVLQQDRVIPPIFPVRTVPSPLVAQHVEEEKAPTVSEKKKPFTLYEYIPFDSGVGAGDTSLASTSESYRSEEHIQNYFRLWKEGANSIRKLMNVTRETPVEVNYDQARSLRLIFLERKWINETGEVITDQSPD